MVTVGPPLVMVPLIWMVPTEPCVALKWDSSPLMFDPRLVMPPSAHALLGLDGRFGGARRQEAQYRGDHQQRRNVAEQMPTVHGIDERLCCHDSAVDHARPVSYTHLRAHETPEHLV